MIITDKIKIKISRKTITHFRNLGYDINVNDIIYIKPTELTDGSHLKIDVKCDICGNEKNIMYQKYIKNIKNGNIYCCSSKCAQIKVKQTTLDKYGTEYYTQTQEYKKKYTETSLNKYGTNHHTQSNVVKDKIKKTNINKYGVDNPSKSDIVKDKIKNTVFEKYGVDNISKLDEIKDKISKSNITFFNNKGFNVIEYKNNNYKLYCEKCKNQYFIHKKTLRNRINSNVNTCTICNKLSYNISNLEMDLLNFIRKFYHKNIIINSKNIISPYELDIYLPDLNLAFEFNGVYWHNELHREKDYHKIKTDLCLEKDIQLIHIYEDDWVYKQDIIKSMILNKLNKSKDRIYARKCNIKEITDNKLIKKFLDGNHIQGFVGSKIKIGLFYNDKLVSLMIFGKLRKPLNSSPSENEYEMLRFCNNLNTNVIGGASRLFKYFIRNYNPSKIISYADRSYSNGNLYKQLGFELNKITEPNYYYIIDDIKQYRYSFRKDILIKQGFDPNKSEHEIMLERKIYRIYNSGNYKFIFIT